MAVTLPVYQTFLKQCGMIAASAIISPENSGALRRSIAKFIAACRVERRESPLRRGKEKTPLRRLSTSIIRTAEI